MGKKNSQRLEIDPKCVLLFFFLTLSSVQHSLDALQVMST